LSLAVTKIARYEISKNLEANALNIAHPSEHLPNAFLSHVPKSYKSLVYQNPKNNCLNYALEPQVRIYIPWSELFKHTNTDTHKLTNYNKAMSNTPRSKIPT
jgi:hypothetical protein